MKSLIILILILMTSAAWAAETPEREPSSDTIVATGPNSWRFGIGLGVQAQMQDMASIEVGTGELFQWRRHGFGIVAEYTGRDTVLEDIDKEHYTIHSYKVMLDSRLHGSIEGVSSYVRLGLGYTDTKKIFHPKGGFLMMPLELGLEVKIMQTDWSYLNFFAAVGSEINFLGNNTPAKDFDGTSITLGFRGYY